MLKNQEIIKSYCKLLVNLTLLIQRAMVSISTYNYLVSVKLDVQICLKSKELKSFVFRKKRGMRYMRYLRPYCKMIEYNLVRLHKLISFMGMYEG